ncbi:hypothetical protein BG004_007095 [Podila humilis]|nr:hypothetical protein BG004_007095 [Podila humilis]
MPKVRGSKTRVHHKAVGGVKSAPVDNATPTPSITAVAAPESLQQLKAQFGLELEEDRENKKDKRKIRHDKWMSKLEATYNPQKKKKKSAQNQTLSVDFGSFHDVLSTLDPSSVAATTVASSGKAGNKKNSTITSTSVSASSTVPKLDHQQFTIHSESSKPLQSKKAKKKAAMQEILRFQNVLSHPAFKSNPLLTIQQHVKNTMEMAPPEQPSTTGVESMED